MQGTYRRRHIGLYKCTPGTVRRRSISLVWTSPCSRALPVLERPFFSTTPPLTPVTPQLTIHNATPTFPSLGQAHKRLSKSGVGEMAAGSPRTAPLPSGSVGSSPRFQRHRLLAPSDGAGAPPGGQTHSAVPGSRVTSTCGRPVGAGRPWCLSTAGQGTLTADSGPAPALALSECNLRSQVLRAPFAKLRGPATAVIQFSHLGDQERIRLSRGLRLLGREAEPREGRCGLFPAPNPTQGWQHVFVELGAETLVW